MEATEIRTYSFENEISENVLGKREIAKFEGKIIDDFINFVIVNKLKEAVFFSYLLKFGITASNFIYLEGEISTSKIYGHEKSTYAKDFIDMLKMFIKDNRITTISEFSYFYKFTKSLTVLDIQNSNYQT